MEWLNISGGLASIVGLAVSAVTLWKVRSIRQDVLLRTRLPDVRKQMQSSLTQLKRWQSDVDECHAACARLLPHVRYLSRSRRNKHGKPEIKELLGSLQKYLKLSPSGDAAAFEAAGREVYAACLAAIEMIKYIDADMRIGG